MSQHFNLTILTESLGNFCSALSGILGGRDYTRSPKDVGVPSRNQAGNQ